MSQSKKKSKKTLFVKIFLIVICGMTIFYLFNQVIGQVELMNLTINDILTKSLSLTIQKIQIPSNVIVYTSTFSLIIPIFLIIFIGLLAYGFSLSSKRERRQGEEHGSARWGNSDDIAPYIDPDYKNNILLTQTERLTLNPKMADFRHNRNKNVLIVGGTGSGKTSGFTMPNVLQQHSSYVLTDPKGTFAPETIKVMEDAGYKVKILNTINFNKSMRYNPFHYIKDEKDILKIVQVIMENTSGDNEKKNDDFWTKAEILLYESLISYLREQCNPDEQNIPNLIKLISNMEVREDDDEFKNAIDFMMEDLEKENPHSFAVAMYKQYKLAAGKTAKSILISCAARLAPFAIKQVSDLVSVDELELEDIGKEKTIFYIIMSDTDATFKFITAMAFTQLFNILCTVADDEYGGQLPIPVRCVLDEFANIGKIPQFDKLIATIRSRGISACPIVQSLSQITKLYGKDGARIIEGNCDTTLFLGGADDETAKTFSQRLGNSTIEVDSQGISYGQNRSSSINKQLIKRELMTQDEIQTLDRGKCLLFISGLPPFCSNKLNPSAHEKFIYTGACDKANIVKVDDWINKKIDKKYDNSNFNILNQYDEDEDILTIISDLNLKGTTIDLIDFENVS